MPDAHPTQQPRRNLPPPRLGITNHSLPLQQPSSSHSPPYAPLVSGLVLTLLILSFLDDGAPSSTLRSRNPAHRSASDSLVAAPPADDAEAASAKNSVLSAGELGVRWNGEAGRRRVLLRVPGRARPACSRCSSVQLRRPAMTWRIWNLRGSERSRERNWMRWLVTICLWGGLVWDVWG